MFIDVSRNNGKPYLRLVKSVRVKNSDGFSVSKKVIIHNIGALPSLPLVMKMKHKNL